MLILGLGLQKYVIPTALYSALNIKYHLIATNSFIFSTDKQIAYFWSLVASHLIRTQYNSRQILTNNRKNNQIFVGKLRHSTLVKIYWHVNLIALLKHDPTPPAMRNRTNSTDRSEEFTALYLLSVCFSKVLSLHGLSMGWTIIKWSYMLKACNLSSL